MKALLYVEFFESYKLQTGGIIEAYTTQPFPNYIGVNVPLEWVAGSLESNNGKTKIKVPYKKEEAK